MLAMKSLNIRKNMQTLGFLVVALNAVVALYSQMKDIHCRQDHRSSFDLAAEKNHSGTRRNDTKHVQKETYTHASWCPQAVCHESGLCHPCQRRFLIFYHTYIHDG